MPPPWVKTVEDVIFYYYTKLVIAKSAGFEGNYAFIIDEFKKLRSTQIQMSNYDREILKQMESEQKCAYCGNESNSFDHLIPRNLGGPDTPNDLVKSCMGRNSSKGDRDLIDWWVNHQKRDKDNLPRIPLGIYLKFSYDWNKIHETLGTPAGSLFDLKPFVHRKAD